MMHRRYGFSTRYLRDVFAHTRYDRETLARYQGRFKPNSTVGTWERFKLHIVNEASFAQARRFYKRHYRTLRKAAKRYNVDARYIVGFIGVESRYGTFTGNDPVLDALATLAFHPNRKQSFFRDQLKHLFLFARERGYDVAKLKGSFAGAMGCVQQIPSVARRFNFDFDGDGASVWDIDDCIGSIAKFMHTHGWNPRIAAAYAIAPPPKSARTLPWNRSRRVTLTTLRRNGITPPKRFPQNRAYLLRVGTKGDRRYFLGTTNAAIIKRYNRSVNYIVAIDAIAKAIR